MRIKITIYARRTKVKPSSVDEKVLDEDFPVFSIVAVITRLPSLSSARHFKYPGRRCSRNRLNQKFYGQNLNFDVHQNFFQKPKIYMCTKKNMQKNGQKSPGSTPAPGLTFSL